ncbi:acyl carrier protein [Pseudomonas sp. NFACC24-1]|uniref:acyl carrier protein n=1 Tax=Pseudomonas sp. NFACC24-1 TaxID=1566189 RepID=UPI0011133A43|nr:acyl carrier protein [Pseudomonas sp. NFACC24-1]
MNSSVTERCVETEVIRLLSGYFSTVPRSLSGNSRLVEDLNFDSVDLVEVVMLVEGVFKVELSADEIERWRFVSDIVGLVMAKEKD